MKANTKYTVSLKLGQTKCNESNSDLIHLNNRPLDENFLSVVDGVGDVFVHGRWSVDIVLRPRLYTK